jgi:hypothetical protein
MGTTIPTARHWSRRTERYGRSVSEKNYPTSLRPTGSTQFSLSDLRFDVPVVSTSFTAATTHDLGDRFGGKPVIMYDGTAMFAEVAIQRMLTHANWQARWV